jgi:lipoate-protein ligase A
MQLLDFTFPSPAENLACDEVLLDRCEAGVNDECLRLWESPEVFVVLGYGNHAAREADLTACRASGIPVLRRYSGGGAVVQGPGCLSYALILRSTGDGPLSTITGTTAYIMKRHASLVEKLTGAHVHVSGHSDLTLDGRKFSGNAQRRRQRAVLFHGTFLLHLDMRTASRVLPMPSRQPDYRNGRTHEEFLTNLPVSRHALAAALADAWQATPVPARVPVDLVQRLAQQRYGRDSWTFRL